MTGSFGSLAAIVSATFKLSPAIPVSVVYDLLFLGRSFTGAKAVLAKGWSLSSVYYWQTGQPFTVANANGNQSAIGLSSDRPNMVSSGQPGFQPSLSEWYDVSRFHLQGKNLLGNEGHNELYGPHSQALALSTYKAFPIHENIKLQFRAESFNLFNTPSFSNPATTIRTYTNGIGSSTADAAISSTRPSAIPRQLQFVLRLILLEKAPRETAANIQRWARSASPSMKTAMLFTKN